MAKTARTIDLVFVALWMAFLCASPVFKTVSKITGWPDFGKNPVEENRILERKPELADAPVREWGRRIDAWYNDNFAWRSDVIRLYRDFRFKVAKYPIGDLVPGRGGIVYRRNETWPEIDDYLGAIVLDGELRDGWRMLVEGRATWAEAYGSHYLEAISPVKIQVNPEYAPWTVRNMPGASSRRQLERAMAGSFAESNIVFFTDWFRAESARGRELFYKEDHHVNAYGCWLLYRGIVEAMRDRWFPLLEPTPFYDDPPADVREGRRCGAYAEHGAGESERLKVSAPGYERCGAPEIGIPEGASNFPMCPIRVRRQGDGLYLAMRHDSFMRFPLTSWKNDGYQELAIPLGEGFRDIAMFIFKRFATGELERLVGVRVPDVIIEQIPECKISLGVFGLDETMRRAAEFGRAAPLPEAAEGGGADGPEAACRALALAVFENPRQDGGAAPMSAEIADADGRAVASERVAPGVRRAVFFGEIEGRPPFSAALRGGMADGVRLELRKAP